MSRHQTRWAWGGLLAACGILCVSLSWGEGQTQERAAQQQGPAVESLLPAEAIVYVGWDGSAAHRTAWERTAAYESIYESGLADVMRKLLVFVVQQTGASEQEVLGVLDHVTQHGLSLTVSIPKNGPPLPQVLIVVHHGKTLEPVLSRFILQSVAGEISFNTRNVGSRKVTSAVVPNSPGVEFGWWIEGEHLVLVGGIGAVQSAIAVADGSRPNITTNPLWKKLRPPAPAAGDDADVDVSLVSWVDFADLRSKFGALQIPHPDPAVKSLTVNRILQVLGVDKLGPLVYRSGYKDRALWSEMSLAAPAPRTGLLALWEQQPMTLDDLPPMPVNTSGFHARRLDWSKLHGDVGTLLSDVSALGPPQASAQLDAISAQVSAVLGIDLKQELLDPLGDVVCVYGDQQQGLFGLGIVLTAQVDDAATLRRTVSKLLLRLAAQLGPQFSVRAVPKHGRDMTVLQFAGVPFAPALAVDDDWLVVGLTPQSVEAFLLRLDNKLPRWQPTAEHRMSLKQLPDRFTSITVTDPRETMKGLLGFAPMMLSFVQLGMNQASQFGGQPARVFPVTAEQIPPAELVTKPLFPNVSVCTADEAGLRWRSRTSIPSIPLVTSLGGGSGVAVSATLVALLLPAVQQARTAARRTQSRNNLKQIGLALHNYHDVHKAFPQGTHPNKDLKPEQRLSWQADILPFIDQAPTFNRIDFEKGWNDKANADLTKTPIPVYQNPQAPSDDQTNRAVTHYVGLAGLGKEGPTLPVNDKRAGVFAYDRATRIRDIRDGTSNTIAVSEANKDFGPWAAGGRATIRPLIKKPYINGPDGIGGPFPGGCNVLFCDGSVRFLSQNIDPTILEATVTINGGEVVNLP